MTESLLLALAAAAGGYVVSRVALEGTVYWVMRDDAGGSRRHQSQRARRRLARRAVPGRRGDGRHRVLRADAGAAGDADRAGADAARRTGEGRASRPRPQRADWRPGLRLGAAADLRRDLPAQRDRVVAIRSGLPHGRHGDDRDRQRAEARRDAPGDRGRIDHYGVCGRPAGHAGPAARGVRRHRRRARRTVAYKFVSAEYFDVFGIPIVRGRSFTAAERDGEHPVVIVSESIARALWPNGDGVGETFRLEPDLNSGRSRETNRRCRRAWSPWSACRATSRASASPTSRMRGVFLPTSVDAPKTSVVARVSGDPDLARQTLLDHLTRIDPNMGMIVTMRTVARLETILPADRVLGRR